MRELLLLAGTGASKDWLPDHPSEFAVLDFPEIGGKTYFHCKYKGEKPLTSDYDVNTYLSSTTVPLYQTTNETVKINDNVPLPRVVLHTSTLGDVITINANVVDDQGSLQTQLDQSGLNLPPVLFLPFQKFTGGVSGTVLDEVYFTTTLTDGVISINGTFPSAGNWIMTEKRMNQALKAIGLDFKIQSGDLNIMVRII